jgi:RNA methyltransferase, TrmH family
VLNARALTSGPGRLLHGKVQLFGVEHLGWAHDAGLLIEHVFAVEDALPTLPSWVATSIPVLLVSDGLAKKITDTNYLAPIVGVARVPSTEPVADGRFALVLDDVRSEHLVVRPRDVDHKIGSERLPR